MQGLAGNITSPQMQQLPSGAIGTLGSGWTQDLQSQYGGLGPSVLPQATSTANNLVNNPFSGQAQAGAGTASNLGTTAAQNTFNTGTGLVPYAQQILNTGFDPQNALYNQLFQQTQDQSNVNNAMNGVAGTPYGAGVTNQATNNFNIDWQNQQLQRQEGAAQSAGALDTTGLGFQNAAPTEMLQSAMLPYATYSDIGQGQNTALSQLLGIGSSGESISNMPISDILSLLSGANATNATANNLFGQQLNQSQDAFGQLGTLADTAFSFIPGLSSLFPSGGGVLPGGTPLGQGGIGSA